jgi:hypothetical protein
MVIDPLCRAVIAIGGLVKAPEAVIARSEATWQSRFFPAVTNCEIAEFIPSHKNEIASLRSQ